MAIIMHIEDDVAFRKTIVDCLKPLSNLRLVQFNSLQSFLNYRNWDANLYILDRHFPMRPGLAPDDTSWRNVAKVVYSINESIPVIMLARRPPTQYDLSRYQNIKGAFSKEIFDPNTFPEIVKSFMLGGSE